MTGLVLRVFQHRGNLAVIGYSDPKSAHFGEAGKLLQKEVNAEGERLYAVIRALQSQDLGLSPRPKKGKAEWDQQWQIRFDAACDLLDTSVLQQLLKRWAEAEKTAQTAFEKACKGGDGYDYGFEDHSERAGW